MASAPLSGWHDVQLELFCTATESRQLKSRVRVVFQKRDRIEAHCGRFLDTEKVMSPVGFFLRVAFGCPDVVDFQSGVQDLGVCNENLT